ncbi:MAG: hypothetical protein K0S34_2160 [Bacillales bacterium]|jgi:hypothetical protein|nr:hypothetical protein [Bacillales bacterium]
MTSLNKTDLLKNQPRAYIEGSLEIIGDEIVFFDDETDEAFCFDENFTSKGFDILIRGIWIRADYHSNKYFTIDNEVLPVEDNTKIRLPRKIHYAYQEWLNELSTESFTNFIKLLNRLNYSVYDNIFCHNYGLFLPDDSLREGVNILIFDNTDFVCNIQHHFFRATNVTKDRFEFTQTNGKRNLLVYG